MKDKYTVKDIPHAAVVLQKGLSPGFLSWFCPFGKVPKYLHRGSKVGLGRHDICAQEPTRFVDTDIVPLDMRISLINALANIVLPLPTGPEYITIKPLLMTRLISVRMGGIDGEI